MGGTDGRPHAASSAHAGRRCTPRTADHAGGGSGRTSPPGMRRRGGVRSSIGVVCMALVALWLDWSRALAVWVLFSLFVVAWPVHPSLTPAEERARAWP